MEAETKTTTTKKRTKKTVAQTTETPVETVAETPVQEIVQEAAKTEEVKTEPKTTKKTAKKEEFEMSFVEIKKEKKVEATPSQLTALKHSLGWNESNPPRVPAKAPKDAKPRLYSYRNHFYGPSKPYLEECVEKGWMEHITFNGPGGVRPGFRVTNAGMKFLEEHEGITILSVSRKPVDVV